MSRRPALNLPNSITLLRIALLPLFIVLFYWPAPWGRPVAALVFSLAGLTDWLDGYLARRLGQTSSFGAFLDPVADKLMVAVALVLVVQTDARWWVALSAAVIIGREIAVSALREWLAGTTAREHIRVNWLGKLKTTVQIIALILVVFLQPLFGLPVYEIGLAGLVGAALLTMWSMWIYLHAAWPWLMSDDQGPQNSA